MQAQKRKASSATGEVRISDSRPGSDLAHPQQQLRSQNGNGKCLCRDSVVELLIAGTIQNVFGTLVAAGAVVIASSLLIRFEKVGLYPVRCSRGSRRILPGPYWQI